MNNQHQAFGEETNRRYVYTWTAWNAPYICFESRQRLSTNRRGHDRGSNKCPQQIVSGALASPGHPDGRYGWKLAVAVMQSSFEIPIDKYWPWQSNVAHSYKKSKNLLRERSIVNKRRRTDQKKKCDPPQANESPMVNIVEKKSRYKFFIHELRQ